MAITTQDGLFAALSGAQRRNLQKQSVTTVAGGFYSLWRANGNPGAGATPGSAAGVVCTSATTGAIPYTNPTGGNTMYIGRASDAQATAGTLIVYDRLIHSDSLSGTLTTAQAIGTPALTRDTTGEDVELWLEWTTATGATASNVTVSYTNQAGTAGRTTPSVALIASAPANRMQPLPLQAGDSGVRAVASLTLSASTGTAGNFGIVLMRRKAVFLIPSANSVDVQDALRTGLPVLEDYSCLFLVLLASTTSSGLILPNIDFAQG